VRVDFVVCQGGKWDGVQHSNVCFSGVLLVFNSPVIHHPLALIPWGCTFPLCYVSFLRSLSTYLADVRWSVDSSSFCVRHVSTISSMRCGPGFLALRRVQVPHRIVKLWVSLEDVERTVLVMTSVPSY
jgi:hypothetical protein